MITFLAKTNDGLIVRSTFEDMTFPAGEPHIKRDPYEKIQPTEIAIVQFSAEYMHRDLFALEMWTQLIDGTAQGTKKVVLMPYLPGARADKGWPRGAASYANFLSGCAISHLIVADPHSDFWLRAYDTSYIVAGFDLPAVTVLTPEDILTEDVLKNYDGIIAPDAGATDRAFGVAQSAGLPLYTATKERDFESGKLLKFNIPEEFPSEGNFLIVDDICDGGGTFSGLAMEFFHKLPNVKLDLYVTHGVFSKDALHDIPAMFEKTYTTNSYLSRKHDNLPEGFEVIDIIPQMMDHV